MQTIFKILIITTMVTTTVKGQIPPNWAPHTVEDTVNVPIDIYWDLSFKLNLEEIGSVGNYKDLPKIVKTTPVNGNESSPYLVASKIKDFQVNLASCWNVGNSTPLNGWWSFPYFNRNCEGVLYPRELCGLSLL